ncbi:MAG: hypothetical protein JSW67_02225 [Candidatus Latescibacterota bacterium]|nr:MAG: hypothetical protein JSW67_02225 [Candidatus Latescibacterota bacterium]
MGRGIGSILIAVMSAGICAATVQTPPIEPGSTASPSLGLVEFFEQLWNDHRDTYASHRKARLEQFLTELDLDRAAESTRELFLQLYFLHDLFTCDGPYDCARGGILEIPYLWHWTSNNPRHEIRRPATNALLTEEAPPPRFSRYETFADIDRTPSLYLADLVAETPRYEHPECGLMFTFGWCSEREMAFCLLLSFFGHEGKIVQSSNHVWSEFCIPFTRSNGETILVHLEVDNTYDTFRWEAVASDLDVSTWLDTHPDRGHQRWYNSIARSETERARVARIQMPTASQRRIEDLVVRALHAQPR